MVQELVCHDFIQVRASLRISSQDSLNEVAGPVGYVDVLGEGVAVLPDTPVRGFDVSGLKGRFTYDQCVNDDT